MSTLNKVALVVGAQGVIGRNLVDHLATLGDWNIVGLSRRGGKPANRIRHIAVDLLDRDDYREKLSDLADVTHIFYAAYDKLLEMTDAGLLARATVWAATEQRCANQAFNINNGDLFRWSEMWPKIAHFFELEVAPPLPMSLAAVMADKEPLWNAMIAKYGLEPNPYRDVSSWLFGDFVFSWDYDMFADGSKARRFGFHDHVETEAMFSNIFSDFRRRRIIPR
jgi:nucleoside-diphosphate-sugar epimerase